MNRLIKSICNGFDVPPSDYIGRYSPDYNKYRENAFHAEQELRMKIPAELIAEFDNCMELRLLMVMAAGQDGFIHGFHMGGKLMVQTLT
ncbi:hypothetical protein QMP26_32975 [Enterocloster clostridioformis]